MNSVVYLFVLTLCVTWMGATEAFYFILQTHERICFVHEAAAELSTVTVNYIIRNEFGEKGDFRVTVLDPSKNIVAQPKLEYSNVRQFNFQTATIGRYDLCFSRVSGTGPVEVEVDISAEFNQDYRDPSVPVSAYAVPLTRITPQFSQSMAEIAYLSARQDRFDRTAQSTHTRIIICTLLNAALGIGAALWQIWNLRRFFKQKKIV